MPPAIASPFTPPPPVTRMPASVRCSELGKQRVERKHLGGPMGYRWKLVTIRVGVNIPILNATPGFPDHQRRDGWRKTTNRLVELIDLTHSLRTQRTAHSELLPRPQLWLPSQGPRWYRLDAYSSTPLKGHRTAFASRTTGTPNGTIPRNGGGPGAHGFAGGPGEETNR